MPKGTIWVDPSTQIPYYLEDGPDGKNTATPIGGGMLDGKFVREDILKAQEQNRMRVKPISSGDRFLSGIAPPPMNLPGMSDPFKLGMLPARALLSLPGEVRDITNAAPEVTNPVARPFANVWNHLVTNNPGTLESIGNIENTPIRSVLDIGSASQIGTGLKALPGALSSIFKNSKDLILKRALESRAGLNKTPVPFSLNSLNVKPTTGIDTAKYLAKQGVNAPLPTVGETSKNAKAVFGSSDAGSTALRNTEVGISDLVKARGVIKGKVNPAVRNSISDLLTKGSEAFNPAVLGVLDKAGKEKLIPLVWDELYKVSATGENGILSSAKLIKYVKANGENIRKVIGSEQSAALQRFAHGLKRTQDGGFSAIQGIKDGLSISNNLQTAASWTAVGSTRNAIAAGVRAIPKIIKMDITREGFAKLMADQEGKWVLARIANKTNTDPSLRTDMIKLAAASARVGIPVSLKGAGSSHELNPDEE